MRRFATLLLLGLALYLPLEDLILGAFPVSDLTYLALRQASDFAVLLTLVGLMALVGTLQKGWAGLGRTADFWLVAFLLSATLTLFVNQAALAPWFLNLKAMVRYVPVAYLLANSLGQANLERSFRRVVLAAVALQGAVGIIGFIGGPSVAARFIPRDPVAEFGGIEAGITGAREVQKGWVTGTQSNTIGFAFLMLVGLSMVLSDERFRHGLSMARVRRWAGVAILLLLIYISGSRAALLIGLGLTGGWLLKASSRFQKMVLALVGGGAMFVVVVFASQAFVSTPLGEIFTSQYVEMARRQRLGLLTEVLAAFANAPPVNLLFGFSPDLAIFGEYLRRAMRLPVLLVANMRALEDVYWVALLYYYGLVGIGAWVVFMVGLFPRLGKARQGDRPEQRAMAGAAILMLLAAIPLNLVNQAFEVKAFSFYLWAVVGLALRRPPAPEIRPAAGSHGFRAAGDSRLVGGVK